MTGILSSLKKHFPTFATFATFAIASPVMGSLVSCQASAPKNQDRDRVPAQIAASAELRVDKTDTKPESRDDAYPSQDWQTRKPIQISSRAFNGLLVNVEFHPTYLAMNLPFLFMKPVFSELQTRVARRLISRGESHVTVLTPPEEETLVAAGVASTMVNQIAVQHNMQKAKLTPVCLGMGQSIVDGKFERTFFIVVQAPELVEIRQALAAAQNVRGGEGRFDALRFYSHVTVGFTRRDLFEQDGVIKNSSSCVYPIELLP